MARLAPRPEFGLVYIPGVNVITLECTLYREKGHLDHTIPYTDYSPIIPRLEDILLHKRMGD